VELIIKSNNIIILTSDLSGGSVFASHPWEALSPKDAEVKVMSKNEQEKTAYSHDTFVAVKTVRTS